MKSPDLVTDNPDTLVASANQADQNASWAYVGVAGHSAAARLEPSHFPVQQRDRATNRLQCGSTSEPCRTRSDHHGFMPHMIVLHSLTASLRRAEPAYGNLVALALQGVGYRTPIERTDRKDGTFEVNRRALTFEPRHLVDCLSGTQCLGRPELSSAMRAQVTTGSQGASAAPSVSATMPPFKDRGSSAPKAESSITLCGSLPRQYRCSPQPI